MQRDFDRIRLEANDGPDLPRSQVGPITQCEKILLTGVKPGDRGCDAHPLEGLTLEVFRGCRVRRGKQLRPRPAGLVVDAASCNAEQPCDRLAPGRVVAL